MPWLRGAEVIIVIVEITSSLFKHHILRRFTLVCISRLVYEGAIGRMLLVRRIHLSIIVRGMRLVLLLLLADHSTYGIIVGTVIERRIVFEIKVLVT